MVPRITNAKCGNGVLATDVCAVQVGPSFGLSKRSEVRSTVRTTERIVTAVSEAEFFFSAPGRFLQAADVIFVTGHLAVIPTSAGERSIQL